MELKDFCHNVKKKFDLTKPFKIDDRLVATTGFWIAWKQDDNSISDFSISFPKIEESWFQDFETPYELPEIQMDIVKCKYCKEGIVERDMKCPECDGEGRMECFECEQERDCPECGGIGTDNETEDYPCEDCDGKGNVDQTKPVGIFENKYNAGYLKRLKEVGAKIGVIQHITSHPNCLGFKFNGLTGFLLPVTIE